MEIQSRRLDALGWTERDLFIYLAVTIAAALIIAAILTVRRKKDFWYFLYTVMPLFIGSMAVLTAAVAIRTRELRDVWFPIMMVFATFALWLMRWKEISATITVLLLLVCGISGCGAAGPEKNVAKYMDAMKENDQEAMSRFVYHSEAAETEEEEAADSNSLVEAMLAVAQEYASEIEYSIIESEVDGEMATVTMEVTYMNAGPAVKLALADLVSSSISSAFAGMELDDDDMSAMFKSSFDKQLENVSLLTKSETVDISCILVDGDWLIEDADPMINIYFCNMMEVLNSFAGDSEDGGDGTDAALPEEDAAEAEEDVTEEVTGETAKTAKQEAEDAEQNATGEGTAEPETADGAETDPTYSEQLKFTTWDEYTEVIFTFNYESADVGSFTISGTTYNEETGNPEAFEAAGTFYEFADRSGYLYRETDGSSIGTYTIDQEEDHLVLHVYDEDGTEEFTLLEAQYAYANVG